MTHKTHPTPWLLLVGASVLVSGCLPFHVRVRHHPAPQEVQVPGPPPEAKDEDPGQCPQDGWVWHGGHWKWDDGNYRWQGGNWEPPREDSEYVPPAHRQTDRGWFYRPPHWRKHGKHGGDKHHDGTPGDPDTPDKVRVSAPPAGDDPGHDGDRGQVPPGSGERHPTDETGRHPAPPAGDDQDKHLPRYDPDKIKTQREGPPVDKTRAPAPKAYKGHDQGHRPGAQPRKPGRSPHAGTGGVRTAPPKPYKRNDRGVRPGAKRHKPAKPAKRHDQGHRAGPPSRAKKPAPPRRKKPDTGKRGGNVVKGKIVPEAPGKPRVKPPEGPQVPANHGKQLERRR